MMGWDRSIFHVGGTCVFGRFQADSVQNLWKDHPFTLFGDPEVSRSAQLWFLGRCSVEGINLQGVTTPHHFPGLST